MVSEDLKRKAAMSIVWSAVQKYSTMLVSFVSGIILARLLTPEDYGCIGMLMVFIAISDTIIDGGFGSALIQKKQPTQQDYSTIFWWNMGMSAFLYVVLFFTAPMIARFYNIPKLEDVLRVQALVLFVNAYNLVPQNKLRKDLRFKTLSVISIVSSLVSLVVTVYMASRGCGVWSLVGQYLLMSVVPALLYLLYLRWRPRLCFSKKSFRELFGFGAYIFLTNMVSTFCSKLTSLLIGKFYSPATLGYYSKAVQTEILASKSISSVVTSVTYPIYSQAQDDKELLANMIKRLTTTIAYITFPLMFVLILTAKPLFILLFSEKWVASVPYFQVLCIVGLADCLQAVNTQSIAAIGMSKKVFVWTLIKRSIGLAVIVGGMVCYGIKGLLGGIIIFNYLCYCVNMGLVSKYIGYKWMLQILDLLPIAFVSLLALVVSYFTVGCLELGLYMDGLTKVAIFLLVYIAWSVVFKPESYTYALSMVASMVNKKHVEKKAPK